MARWRGSDALTTAAFLLVTLVAVVDFALQGHAVLIGLLIVGPLVAATGTTPRRTAAVAIYAVVCAVGLGPADGMFLSVDHIIRTSIVGVAGGLSVWAATLREERESALRRIARVAEVAQRAILRPPPPLLGSVAFAARYLSAAEEALIGGDLYETAYTLQGVRVIVGDVRGKGLDAVGLAAAVLGRFREVVFAAPTLVEVAKALDEQVQSSAGTEDFVTAVLVEFPDEGGVRILNCGHHPPLWIGPPGPRFLTPADTTVPLGMGPDLAVAEHGFDDGARLLLYTDGVVEARDASGRFFPLVDEAAALCDGDRQQGLDTLLVRLLRHAGGHLDDDLAVLLAERVS